MKKQIKEFIQIFQIKIFPSLYKRRFFKNLAQLDWKSIRNKNIENELLLIRYFLNKDSIFVDIGANLGQYIFVAENIIEKKNIHAFEPHPKLRARLLKIFTGINVHQYAVSNKNEKSRFKIPFFNHKEIHTRGTLKTNYIDTIETTFKLIEVYVVRLDTICSKLQIGKISLIKIDVEGAEMDVIEGAGELLKVDRPILIIEIEQQHHEDSIFSLIAKIETDNTYKCYYFDPIVQQLKGDIHEREITQIQSASNHAKNRSFINNFIFLPLEKFNSFSINQINQKIVEEQRNI